MFAPTAPVISTRWRMRLGNGHIQALHSGNRLVILQKSLVLLLDAETGQQMYSYQLHHLLTPEQARKTRLLALANHDQCSTIVLYSHATRQVLELTTMAGSAHVRHSAGAVCWPMRTTSATGTLLLGSGSVGHFLTAAPPNPFPNPFARRVPPGPVLRSPLRRGWMLQLDGDQALDAENHLNLRVRRHPMAPIDTAGYLYITTHHAGTRQVTLHALDAYYGATRWRFDMRLGHNVNPMPYLYPQLCRCGQYTVVVAGGTVYTLFSATGRLAGHTAIPLLGRLHALHSDTNQHLYLAWRTPRTSPDDLYCLNTAEPNGLYCLPNLKMRRWLAVDGTIAYGVSGRDIVAVEMGEGTEEGYWQI